MVKCQKKEQVAISVQHMALPLEAWDEGLLIPWCLLPPKGLPHEPLEPAPVINGLGDHDQIPYVPPTSFTSPTLSCYSTITVNGTTKDGLLPVRPLSNRDSSAVPLLHPDLAEVTDLLPASTATGSNAPLSWTGERRCLRGRGQSRPRPCKSSWWAQLLPPSSGLGGNTLINETEPDSSETTAIC